MARPGRHPAPTTAFCQRPLSIARVPKTHRWLRLHQSKYPPLYFGRTRLSRFDAPDGRFGTLYVARQLEGAFVETFCRSAGALHPISEVALEQYSLCAITASRALKLADLAGKGLVRMGLDNRLGTGDYRIAQRWGAAIYTHPDQVDGILYTSRHDPKRQCAVLFDRVQPLLTCHNLSTLRVYLGDSGFFALLEHYGVALL